MPRLICLAQAHAVPKRSRSKTGSAKSAGTKSSATNAADVAQTFTILERVPVRLSAHKPVWDGLRQHGVRQPVIDSEHPDETLAADVVAVEQLGSEAIASITATLAERRATALAAEKETPDGDILAKRLDRIFEQEMEWLAIRNLIATALPRSSAKGGARRKKASRALLLID